MSTTDDNNEQQCNGGGELTSNTNECPSCEQNNIDNITEGFDSVAIQKDDMSTCASCGKEGNSKDMNTCNKCQAVKYCNAACKKKYRSKHKKACERRVAELRDEQLFKEIELKECPICMLPLPIESTSSIFKSCCGKRICLGCMYTMIKSEEVAVLCPYCRTPPPTSEKEEMIRIMKLMDKCNGEAFHMLAHSYDVGVMGMQQDNRKANELYLKAGEFGCGAAYYNLGVAYQDGRGVEEADEKKTKNYWELAAIRGCISARYFLGCLEGQEGNYHRAMKHLTIAARAGHETSLDKVKHGFMNGLITKDDYANTLRAYQKIQVDMKNDERDQAAIHYVRVRR